MKEKLEINIDDNLIEELSNVEHISWSKWMESLFNKSTKNDDGSVTIPKELVYHWQRQIDTPYEELSNVEKNSDRNEVKRQINVLRKITKINILNKEKK